ncbi:MAG: hypothetical protein M1820_003874 [Bogoriella megaspora]|nr:MAG: hypothetical protein M1820_003874 [Bogoriella megaspora]
MSIARITLPRLVREGNLAIDSVLFTRTATEGNGVVYNDSDFLGKTIKLAVWQMERHLAKESSSLDASMREPKNMSARAGQKDRGTPISLLKEEATESITKESSDFTKMDEAIVVVLATF